LSLTGCDNGGGGGGGGSTVTYTGTAADGTTYTLEITENTTRYTAQSGDTYKLTAGVKISTGTVSTIAGGVLTLAPSKNGELTFTVTISGNGISAMSGTITWDDGTTAAAPTQLTPQTDGDDGSSYLGLTPTIASGEQVYTFNENDKSYSAFDGSLTLATTNGVTGAITNGKLTLSLGTPTTEELEELIKDAKNDLFVEDIIWSNINPTNLQGLILDSFEITDSNEYDALFRENTTSSDYEIVAYMYVADDVIITGKGGKEIERGDDTVTSTDLNLPLKKGWNTVLYKQTKTTLSVSLGNPNHIKWVIAESSD